MLYLGNLNSSDKKRLKNEPELQMSTIVIASTNGSGNPLQTTSQEPVPVSVNNWNSWLDVILKVILEEHQTLKRNIYELVQDIRIALGYCSQQCWVFLDA